MNYLGVLLLLIALLCHSQLNEDAVTRKKEFIKYENLRPLHGPDLIPALWISDKDCRQKCIETPTCVLYFIKKSNNEYALRGVLGDTYKEDTKHDTYLLDMEKAYPEDRERRQYTFHDKTATSSNTLFTRINYRFTFSFQIGENYKPVSSGDLGSTINDKFSSDKGISVLTIQRDKVLVIKYASVAILILDSNTVLAKPDACGRLQVRDESDRNYFYGSKINNCQQNSWEITITNDGNVMIKSKSGTSGFQTSLKLTDFPYWGFHSITGKSFEVNGNMMNKMKSYGKDTVIYYLDSGVNVAYDTSNALGDSILHAKFRDEIWISTIQNDIWNHGSTMVLISKSKFTGLAQGAIVVSLSITDGVERFFNEKTFVQALKWVDEDPRGTGILKIINFSGVFHEGNIPVVNCAIQWAFYKNILVVAAAGNDGEYSETNNPYQLMVGSFTQPGPNNRAKVWEHSSFGSEIDIWAPNEFIGKEKVGTSIATAFTSASLSAAISRYPNLQRNPFAVMRYVNQYSKVDVLSVKEVIFNCSRAQTKSVTIDDFPERRNTNLGSTTLVHDYCQTLKLPKSSPQWIELLKMANITKTGGIVSSQSIPNEGFYAREE